MMKKSYKAATTATTATTVSNNNNCIQRPMSTASDPSPFSPLSSLSPPFSSAIPCCFWADDDEDLEHDECTPQKDPRSTEQENHVGERFSDVVEREEGGMTLQHVLEDVYKVTTFLNFCDNLVVTVLTMKDVEPVYKRAFVSIVRGEKPCSEAFGQGSTTVWNSVKNAITDMCLWCLGCYEMRNTPAVGEGVEPTIEKTSLRDALNRVESILAKGGNDDDNLSYIRRQHDRLDAFVRHEILGTPFDVSRFS